MGSVPSTPRIPQETAEYIIGTFVGEKSFPITSEFWNQLLELPLHFHWSPDRVRQACNSLGNTFSIDLLITLFVMLFSEFVTVLRINLIVFIGNLIGFSSGCQYEKGCRVSFDRLVSGIIMLM